ncbi:MAG: electron transfer flavoprotein subunit alpha/FixB family protein [Oligoflexales bacterium]|nr:electron transfer flavoprotein subunit alpha/FixB family protein [Oligoflexales bacterium]
MKILVYIDQRDANIKSVSYEALTLAHKMAGKSSDVAAVIIGSGVDKATSQLAGWGLDKVYICNDASLAKFNSMAYCRAVESAVEFYKPDLVIGGATPMGRELFPRLAAKLDGGLVTDAIAVEIAGSGIKTVKPLYAGKCLATQEIQGNKIKFVTIRPNVMAAVKPNAGTAAAEVITANAFINANLQTVEIRKGANSKPDLTEASVIISGGRSLASAENFKILFECAEVLGATVGASRAAVDSGYASHDMQVGQTGKTVNPNLYIACGISGSIQHMAGMRTSKVIVAVNTDPDAPIFSVADYGIVADLFKVVPLMTEKFKNLLK